MGCGMLRKHPVPRSEEEEAAAGEGLAEGMLQRTMSEVVRVSETGTVSDDEEEQEIKLQVRDVDSFARSGLTRPRKRHYAGTGAAEEGKDDDNESENVQISVF